MVYKKDETTAYTNTIVMGVNDNFLTPDDVNKDIEQSLLVDLQSSAQEVLQVVVGEDENGNPIYQNAQTYELSGSSYQLHYSGLDIDEAIGWVQTNKTAILSHISNTTIHINSADRDK